MKCSACGKEVKNAHYINGKVYGYNCYKQELALIFKQWEDERNHEYAIKCFSAMKIFSNKKSNTFHDSIVKQWTNCKKLTAKQLECIIKSFTDNERVEFYKVWFLLTDDNRVKQDVFYWIESCINKSKMWFSFMNDEVIEKIFLSDLLPNKYKNGFHFFNDVEIDNNTTVYIMENGREDKQLLQTMNDEFYKIFKIVRPN